jgi:hypothetical protein
MLIKNAEHLREFFPNTLLEIDDEISFFDKVSHYLNFNEKWLEHNVLASGYEQSETVINIASRIVANFAIADAIPSLDIVLTPNGLGVVSTDTIAPASKERVERLIDSLRKSAYVHMNILIENLRLIEDWRGTNPGIHWCGTFIQTLAEIDRWCKDTSPLTVFDRCRELAQSFEVTAVNYIGFNTLATLHQSLFNPKAEYQIKFIAEAFKAAEKRFIQFHYNDRTFALPDRLEVFTLVSSVVNLISASSELSEIRNAELEQISVPKLDKEQGALFL